MTHHSDRRRLLATGLVLGVVLAACGSDATTSTTASTTTTTAAATTTTAGPVTLEQPAIWRAADVVFTTPEAAAQDFVSKVLRVPPNLGEFQQGDSRSGEMEVLSPDAPGARVPRSLLLLRQLGPKDGWFVLAAVNEHETVTTPQSGATVGSGPLTVAGRGRGFEATVVVRAVVAGDATDQIDQVIARGGAPLRSPSPSTSPSTSRRPDLVRRSCCWCAVTPVVRRIPGSSRPSRS